MNTYQLVFKKALELATNDTRLETMVDSIKLSIIADDYCIAQMTRDILDGKEPVGSVSDLINREATKAALDILVEDYFGLAKQLTIKKLESLVYDRADI